MQVTKAREQAEMRQNEDGFDGQPHASHFCLFSCLCDLHPFYSSYVIRIHSTVKSILVALHKVPSCWLSKHSAIIRKETAASCGLGTVPAWLQATSWTIQAILGLVSSSVFQATLSLSGKPTEPQLQSVDLWT